MAQVVENWADVTGSVTAIEPDPASESGFATIRVAVERVDPVEGSPNLLEDRVGTSLDVRVSRAGVGPDIVPGVVIRCRARKAAAGVVFAHPDGPRVEP